MSAARVAVFTLFALLAFAGNSLLCRAALIHTDIDPVSFTAVRLISGALVLWLLISIKADNRAGEGNWWSALALFVYAIAFSVSYVSLSTAAGALLLFGAVQASMIAYGFWRGERFTWLQSLGFIFACAGLVGLLLPGLSAPPFGAGLLMMLSGVAWGVYSLRGKGGGDPIKVTAGNFIRTVPIALILVLVFFDGILLDLDGVWYAVLSGALTSGLGYALWYTALPYLKASTAATVQLSVPLVAAVGAVLFLAEPFSVRLILASIAILGGIALVTLTSRQR
ncbi:DMT family transporter [Rheinheimera mangrovi]|uniref:DMT family transporter n=1 Tax=Rheinheimera mangrovi TaxID=2498451 RepID=UPI000F8E32CB|nr:DMT family transporter [Rheinheimera mangrovi]